MGTKRQYSDEDKAAALAAYRANGGVLKRTAREMGIPVPTLRRWVEDPEKTDSAANQVATMQPQKLEELATLYESEIYNILDALPAKRPDATYKDLVTSIGILTDKMRVLRGLPTEIIQVLPPLVTAMQDAGLNPSDVFNAMLARLHADGYGKRSN